MNAPRLLRRALPLASLLLLAPHAALAVVQPESGIGFPRDVSVDGHRIDWLINVTGIFVAILFVIMCVWIAMACLKHGRNHAADYDHGDGKHSVTTALVLSAAIFFVVDGNLFYWAVRDLGEAFWNFKTPRENPNTIKVEINARQWAWDIRQAGPDKLFATPDDIITLNDLRVPVGVPIYIQIGASDVIHSIFFPNFRQKIDAVPGTINRLWFQAKETGEFQIACTQHCGVNHYLMKGVITVMTPEDYAAWAAQAGRISTLAYDADDPSTHWGWDWKETD
jgi:cytochrome c oxidase subunit 2